MKHRNNGSVSAFPKYFGGNRDLAPGEEAGMSLRDYFAAQALPAVMRDSSKADVLRFAEWAYAIADAMLAERDKESA